MGLLVGALLRLRLSKSDLRSGIHSVGVPASPHSFELTRAEVAECDFGARDEVLDGRDQHLAGILLGRDPRGARRPPKRGPPAPKQSRRCLRTVSGRVGGLGEVCHNGEERR